MMIKNGLKNRKKICIVTPEYIYANPRTVKEADALWEAGFDVRVVFSQGNLEKIREFDSQLLKEKPWRWDAVGWSSFRKDEVALYIKSKVRYHLARMLPLTLHSIKGLAERGEARVYSELARLAAKEKADLYLGHYPAGLAASAFAASFWKTKLGYDIEDLHTEEGGTDRQSLRRKERVRLIESRYLPHCAHISCVSDLIAGEITRRYGVKGPVVLYNCFPWKERERIDGEIKDRKGPGLSLYWFSQVIGEDRGIQDVIKAVGLLKGQAQLHLRGYLSENTKINFTNLAKAFQADNHFYFHPAIPPAELISRTVEHDVGLDLSPPVDLNRTLTLSNKFFFYLLAGLATCKSEPYATKQISSLIQKTGFYCPSGDYKALAKCLEKFILDPALLQQCKENALQAAKERWNWEEESKKLIENINSALDI
jgi:glycosyltransferase involved in cell wall biosynthesis